ncbi:hypothetical protein BLOT_004293 [Blomia tropicalis]|nr:hypothetical protein BLOT_004293 [Blomia tropicalis]
MKQSIIDNGSPSSCLQIAREEEDEETEEKGKRICFLLRSEGGRLMVIPLQRISTINLKF